MIHLITELMEVEPYKLTLRFNTGEIRLVDLKAKLDEWTTNSQSKFAQLQDPDYFITVRFDPEFNSVVWGNGIDFCPDVLYKMSSEVDRQNVA